MSPRREPVYMGRPGGYLNEDVMRFELIALMTGGFDHGEISPDLPDHGLRAGHGHSGRGARPGHERHHDLSSNPGGARRHSRHRHARSSLALRAAAGHGGNRSRQGNEPV